MHSAYSSSQDPASRVSWHYCCQSTDMRERLRSSVASRCIARLAKIGSDHGMSPTHVSSRIWHCSASRDKPRAGWIYTYPIIYLIKLPVRFLFRIFIFLKELWRRPEFLFPAVGPARPRAPAPHGPHPPRAVTQVAPQLARYTLHGSARMLS